MFLGGHLALLLVYLVAGGPLRGLAGTLVVLALLGLFYASTDGVLAAMASQATPEQTRGTGIAAVQTVVVVARFASSLLFGGIWVVIGRGPALFAAAGALAVMLTAATWLLWPTIRPPGGTGAPAQREPVSAS